MSPAGQPTAKRSSALTKRNKLSGSLYPAIAFTRTHPVARAPLENAVLSEGPWNFTLHIVEHPAISVIAQRIRIHTYFGMTSAGCRRTVVPRAISPRLTPKNCPSRSKFSGDGTSVSSSIDPQPELSTRDLQTWRVEGDCQWLFRG